VRFILLTSGCISTPVERMAASTPHPPLLSFGIGIGLPVGPRGGPCLEAHVSPDWFAVLDHPKRLSAPRSTVLGDGLSLSHAR